MENIPIELLRREAVLFGQGPAPTAEYELQPSGAVRIQLPSPIEPTVPMVWRPFDK